MLNSVFLMFSQYEKNRKVSNIFKIIWVLYAVAVSFFNFNPTFFIINLSAFLLLTEINYFMSKLGQKTNIVLSIFSILIYSFIVDIICYFVFPAWAQNVSLIGYITNGLLFNLKYVALNTGVMVVSKLIFEISNKCRTQKLKLIYKI